MMKLMKYLLTIICILGQYLYIRCSFKKKYSLGLICKTIASISFLIIGLIGYLAYNLKFNQYIVLGFIFDLIGDVLLAIRNIVLHDEMFFTGTISFMVGHIFYVLALASVINKGFNLCFLIGIVIGIIIYLYFYIKISIPKAFKIIGVIYTSLLSIIFVLSLCHYINNPIRCNLMFMIGSILFSLSDYTLIYNCFGKKKWWMHPLYSFLYYIAQLIIGFSMFV